MSLYEQIEHYAPGCEQEARDQQQMLRFMREHDDCLSRDNLVAHMTTSIWTVNPQRTRTLLVYHNIYDSWSWIGGHADGSPNLHAVALRELAEETGVCNARLVSDDIFSLETLTVAGHVRRGIYVPCHLHFNVTYLAEALEDQPLKHKADENQAVRWWALDDVATASTEPWMVAHVYQKLIERTRR